MIDMAHVRMEVEMKKRNDIIAAHPYEIWKGEKHGKEYWYTYIPNQNGKRVQKCRRTREGIEELIISYYQNQRDTLTVEDVFHLWNQERLDLKMIKQATFTREQQVFKSYFNPIKGLPMDALSEDILINFLEQTVAHGVKSKDFSNIKSLLRTFLKWAKKKKYTSVDALRVFWELDISDRQFIREYKEPEKEVFQDWELDRLIPYLLEHKKDVHCMAMLLLFVTGIRIGELVALEKTDIGDDNSIRISKSETRYNLSDGSGDHYEITQNPKTEAGYRRVYLPESASWIIDWMRSREGDYIFMFSGHRLTTAAVRSKMYRICDKAGVGRKSPHKLRKTYLSIMLDEKLDKRLITDQVGHTDIRTSEAYYHKNRKTAAKKVAILSQIDEFERVAISD